MLSLVTVTLAMSLAGTSIVPLLIVVVARGVPPARKATAAATAA
jgi:pyruvate/2-oxoacid:ferredoxin oxidoreductase alpha subunit